MGRGYYYHVGGDAPREGECPREKGEEGVAKMPDDQPTMLTIQEVADLLRVHPNTVRKWSNTGLLRAFRIGKRGDRRFALVDVARLLDGNRASSSQGPAAEPPPLALKPIAWRLPAPET